MTDENLETGAETGNADTSNREAAKWRTKLRETETELTSLRDQLATVHRSEAERLAATHNVTPAAFWAAGNNVDDLLTENGTVDPEKVAAAAETTRTALGIPPVPTTPSTEGQGRLGEPIGGKPAKDFGNLFGR